MRKTTAGIVFLMILTLMCGAALAQTRVLATTFPVYQIVRNITQNVPDVEVQLMLPAQAGCPHDYALTPQDMSKLAQADILVLNGLGLEAFLGSPSARAKKELHTIDSSKGISGLLPYTDAEEAHEEHEGLPISIPPTPQRTGPMPRTTPGRSTRWRTNSPRSAAH